MNKFKNAAIGIVGIILMITIVSALIPMTGHGQGGTIAKDVAVINTPSVNVTNPVV